MNTSTERARSLQMFKKVEARRRLSRTKGRVGATGVYCPVVKPDYQMLEFAERDLNGYVLGFGQRRDPNPPG